MTHPLHPLLRPLRWHLAAFAACLLCSALMLHISWKHYAASKAQAHRAEQQAGSMASAVRRLSDDESQIRQQIDRFRELKEKGVIGADKPTESAGFFRKLRRDLRLDGLDYELSEPAPLTGEAVASAGDFRIQARQLQLRLALLHEEDLLRALDLLSQRAPAILRLRECRIDRASDTRGSRSASLLAKCQFEWITLSKAGGG